MVPPIEFYIHLVIGKDHQDREADQERGDQVGQADHDGEAGAEDADVLQKTNGCEMPKQNDSCEVLQTKKYLGKNEILHCSH